MELDPQFVDYFHNLSLIVIAGMVFLTMGVAFFVFKYSDHDFWNNDSYGD